MAWKELLDRIPKEIRAKNISVADYLRSLGKEKTTEILKLLPDDEIMNLAYDWRFWGRPNQMPPSGDWTYWVFLAGRGAGKTRSASEWVKYRVEHEGARRIALVGPTAADVRDVIIEGDSGILSVYPEKDRPLYESSKRRITWPNGAIATAYSAEEPDRLRGPQHDTAIGDEWASWQSLQETWDNLNFGLRLGSNPRCMITTTPRPLMLLRDLIEQKNTVVTRGSSHENKNNLSKNFFTSVISKYEGTQLGRQEIYAEILSENEEAIFKKKWFQLWPADEPFPEFKYIVQSYDTAFSEKTHTNADCTFCTTWGVFYPPDRPNKSEELDGIGFCVMLLDCWGERIGFPELRKKAIDEYQMLYGAYDKAVDIVLIEDKGSGISLRQELHKAGVPVMPYNPGKADKVQRAHAVSYLVYNKLAYVPESTKKRGEFRAWANEWADQICTVAGTKIITKHGLKNIEDISIGEDVLTHLGRFRKVIKTSNRFTESTYIIQAKGCDPIRITGEHPFYAMDLKWNGEINKIDWVKAKDIKPRNMAYSSRNGKKELVARQSASHALTMPIPFPECLIESIDLAQWAINPTYKGRELTITATHITNESTTQRQILRHQKLDFYFGRLCGLYLAEGSTNKYGKIQWSFNSEKEQHLVKETKDFLLYRFGIHAYDYNAKESKSVNVAASMRAIQTFFHGFGTGAINKNIPSWVWNAPDNFVRGLIDGYVEGDGCVYANKNITCVTISHSLAHSMKLLASRVGINAFVRLVRKAKIQKTPGNDRSNCKNLYCVQWQTSKKRNGSTIEHPKYHGRRVIKKEEIKEDILVYNIEVEQDNSYVTTAGTLHNCNFPMIGMKDDAVDSTTQALKLLSDQTWLKLDDAAPEIMEDDVYDEPAMGENPYG